MKINLQIIIFMLLLFVSVNLFADESSLQNQIDELNKRVVALERQVSVLAGQDNWKDPVYWQKLKKEMHETDVKKILGKPARVETQIFTTWYYHQTSKLHSYIWFDEGKVLGWKLPEK